MRCFKKFDDHTYKLVYMFQDKRYNFFPKTEMLETKSIDDIYEVIYNSSNYITIYYSDDSTEIITNSIKISSIMDYINDKLCD